MQPRQCKEIRIKHFLPKRRKNLQGKKINSVADINDSIKYSKKGLNKRTLRHYLFLTNIMYCDTGQVLYIVQYCINKKLNDALLS